MSYQKSFTRSHASARIRSFSTARLYLMAVHRAISATAGNNCLRLSALPCSGDVVWLDHRVTAATRLIPGIAVTEGASF